MSERAWAEATRVSVVATGRLEDTDVPPEDLEDVRAQVRLELVVRWPDMDAPEAHMVRFAWHRACNEIARIVRQRGRPLRIARESDAVTDGGIDEAEFQMQLALTLAGKALDEMALDIRRFGRIDRVDVPLRNGKARNYRRGT